MSAGPAGRPASGSARRPPRAARRSTAGEPIASVSRPRRGPTGRIRRARAERGNEDTHHATRPARVTPRWDNTRIGVMSWRRSPSSSVTGPDRTSRPLRRGGRGGRRNGQSPPRPRRRDQRRGNRRDRTRFAVSPRSRIDCGTVHAPAGGADRDGSVPELSQYLLFGEGVRDWPGPDGESH